LTTENLIIFHMEEVKKDIQIIKGRIEMIKQENFTESAYLRGISQQHLKGEEKALEDKNKQLLLLEEILLSYQKETSIQECYA